MNHPVFAHYVREATPPNLGGNCANADGLLIALVFQPFHAAINAVDVSDQLL